jgi:polyhydroxybutyrate depolymerase
VLHGSGGQGQTLLEKTGWARKAEEENFIAVAPDALPMNLRARPNFFINPRMWNGGQLGSDLPRAQVDDVGFFRALLDDLSRRLNIDPDRVYVTGHSNGAAMTFRLGAELSDQFAAIAPVSSICWLKNPQPSQPLSTVFIVGTEDPLVPLLGGESFLPWGKRTTPPIATTIRLWAEATGCPPNPRGRHERGEARIFEFGPGRGETDFVVYLVEGQGHNWPGGKEIVPLVLGPQNPRFHATDVIWDFFRSHPRPKVVVPTTRDGRFLVEPTGRRRLPGRFNRR